jgi:RNA polymerase sigma-70 factor (ECF subfamily)
MTERTNEEWLTQLAAKGAARDEAIAALQKRLERGLYYYLRTDRSDLSRLTNEAIEQMAQDFAQDAMLKILDNLHTFRGESKFTTWASKIASRVAISELRRVRYKNFSLEGITIDGQLMPNTTEVSVAPVKPPNPERAAERQDIMQIVFTAINEVLTERQRTAIVAIALEGVSVEIVAERMDTNRNALYKLVHDARVKLKDHLVTQGLSVEYVMNLFNERE